MIARAREFEEDAPLDLTWPARACGAPTRRACEAASRFGLLLDEHMGGARANARPVRVPTRDGEVALFTGPSGAGKSTLLREAERALRARGVRVVRLEDVALRDRPCVDLLGRSVDEAVRALARVGLGEAECFLRRPGELSDGQRWRLRLAMAIDRATRDPAARAALVIDECCATLDPCSTLAACATLRRAVRRTPGLRALCAGANMLLERALRPDVVVRVRAPGEARVERPALPEPTHADAGLSIDVAPAALRDYLGLAAHHYRAARPARPALTLAAWLREPRTFGHDGSPIGALVVAFPALNSAVRDVAWPGEYRTGDRVTDAKRLNEGVRAIARVVVEPRFRGLGVATALVRAYLASPLTRRTESTSAMGEHARFHEGAGMTRHDLPVRAPDARLLDSLAHAGVEEWRLAQGRATLRRVIEGGHGAFLERELRLWAADGRAHKRWRDAPLEELFLRACRFAACRPAGHTYEQR